MNTKSWHTLSRRRGADRLGMSALHPFLSLARGACCRSQDLEWAKAFWLPSVLVTARLKSCRSDENHRRVILTRNSGHIHNPIKPVGRKPQQIERFIDRERPCGV